MRPVTQRAEEHEENTSNKELNMKHTENKLIIIIIMSRLV
jgi:hypothetical protein